jgi:hypothetical protein
MVTGWRFRPAGQPNFCPFVISGMVDAHVGLMGPELPISGNGKDKRIIVEKKSFYL